ncbi:MAG: glutamine-hydrolyzing carbamoyl-phosphate synthase small subunit [Firmicutes bacterium]|nr:glutamine-hydrolyzing carbamoyl-phosphate synthase small subunit [Bacillota bacterium]MDD7602067.1 glutamine-hydrolyzing carbamoyl-phosphate synthase small subunit [Bacillota bacterium]MDY5855389.1 glutamine-hydrolyzing carbamoyl-phosphate synthase small subunit [Anaerovoracaceae bacterium]
MEGKVYLEDGSLFEGEGFGACKTCVGELVFNTAMTGYQKTLTDPSYLGQVITMTWPLAGNYGINKEDDQSDRIYACGLVVKEVCETPSNYRCEKTLSQWLTEMDVPGVAGVDTRKITKKIRQNGTVKCVITTESLSYRQLKKLCEETSLRTDYMKEAAWAGPADLQEYKEEKLNVAVLDFGAKRSILQALEQAGCNVHLFPYGFTAEEVLAIHPDGVFLSNGPGDPAAAQEAIAEVRKLMHADRQDGKPLPMFGICMGHQILALAAGGRTYKLKYGHRGANHGVYSKETGRSCITSQNHGYAVEAESILLHDMEVTELNLNDRTVEGMRHRTRPIFSVQYHPEANPGPADSQYLFDRFVEMMKK